MLRSIAIGAGFGGLGLAAVALLSFFGSLLWIFDLAANFRPQFSLLLVVLGGVSLAGGRRRLAWPVLGVGLIGLASMVPHFLDHPPAIAGDSPTIRVMAFNGGISNPNRAAVAAFIADEDPDVVFIFESSFEWEDTIRDADLPLQIISVVPRGQLSGVTVLARPDLKPGYLEVSLDGDVAAVTVDLGGQRIDVLGLHPLSPTTAARSDARDRLMARAADWVVGRDAEVVVVGDFNATPWSHAYSLLRDRAGLVDTLRGRGLQPSWPEGWGPLMIPIDHIFHTAGLGSANRRTGPAFGSAHRPVLVEIGFSS